MGPTPKIRWKTKGPIMPRASLNICECIADLLRLRGETLIWAAEEGASELKD